MAQSLRVGVLVYYHYCADRYSANAIDLKTIFCFYATKTFFTRKGLDFALFSKREFVELEMASIAV